MDTKDEKEYEEKVNNAENETVETVNETDEEEYYDENADAVYDEKYVEAKKPSLYKRYRQNKNNFVISCLIFALLLSLLFGPVFKVKEITVTGNSRISRDMVLQKSDIVEGINILAADVTGAQRKIATIPFVYEVEVKRAFPSTVNIMIKECVEVGFISYMGNYVGTSSLGKILEITKERTIENVPIINGIELKEANVGKDLVFADEKVGETALKYMEAMENIDIISHIKSIDFTDINDVKLVLSNDILVKMGGIDKVSYKFAYLEKIFVQLEGQRGGVLDISDPASSVVYQAS